MIRKLSTLVLSLMVSTFVAQAQTPPDNEIWYTTTDGKKAELWMGSDSFEENGWYFEIISHTYSNGLGIIHANKPIKAYGYEEDGDAYIEFRLRGNNIKTITFPKCTEYFYDLIFNPCRNLRTIKCRYSSSDGRCLIKNGRLLGFAPGGLTKYTIPNSVKSIGHYAFEDCSSLTSIIIPNSVASIGWGAFWGCSSLKSITIPNSVTSIGREAFYGCSSLTNITIPESVTSIEDYAFYGCSSLTSITIPNSVTSIGYLAFNGCSSLTSITIPNSVTSIGDDAFKGCSSLKSFKGKFASEDGRCLIKDGELIAFAPAGLTSITIPNSVTWIGNWAFWGCSSLTSITIPNSVTIIGGGAFWGCSSLTSITIPNSVTIIGGGAFEDCSSLTSITIPNSVTSIGKYAFYGCSSLTSINIPNSVTEIGDYAFRDCNIQSVIIDTVTGDTSYIKKVFGDNKIAGYRGKYASEDGRCLIVNGKLIDVVEHDLTTYTIPDGVVEIGNKAFVNCTELTSITIPESVTTIKSSAFNGCDSIKALSLDTNEFNADCIYLGNLEELTLGTSVEDVAEGTFAKSPKLKRLTINTEHFSGKWVDISRIEEITIAPGITILDSNALSGFSGKLIVNHKSISKATLAGANPAEIRLGENVENIEYDTFSACSNLVKFSGSNTTEDGCNVVVNGRLIAVIQANLTEYVVPEGVTEIGSYVFKGCTSLTNVNMPESLTAIGKYAFYGCSSLTQITLPEGITKLENGVFAGCGLTSIDLPNSITSIDACAFKDCSKLKSVTIPNSVTSFGKSAFEGCDIEQITVNAMTGNMFKGCPGLSTYKVVAYKGDYASADGRCIVKDGVLINILHKGVVTYTIPSEIKVINRELFKGCTSLAKLFITENVTEIGAEAFKDCNNLKSVIIANSVTTIGKDAFAGCNIEQIVVNAVTGNKIPYGNGLAADKVVAYTGKHASEDGLCLIKHGTLLDYLHRGNTTYTIPEGVKVISSRVFSGCSSLVEVIIAESVAEIGTEAFKGCSGITSVTIPAGTTWIGEGAFSNCSAITEITCLATLPPTISDLGIADTVVIYVPKEAMKEYKKDPNWARYLKQLKRAK